MTAIAAVRRPPTTTSRTQSPFAPLRSHSYRIYLGGQSLASVGGWMGSIAQDWLVLRLTHSSTAVGLTLSFQFVPVLLFSLHGGLLADRYAKRRILLITQTINMALSVLLAALTLSGAVRVEQVWAIAVIGGFLFAVNAPTQQAFVNEVVSSEFLRGAVSLNAAVSQSTRLVGPALASVLISTIGTGWVFAATALCGLGPMIGLHRLRTRTLSPAPVAPREPRALRSAGQYVLGRPHVFWTIVLAGVVGTFGLNYPIVLSAMATRTFHEGAGAYGLFNVALGIGSMSGALLAGSWRNTRLRLIVAAGSAFGFVQALAAAAPGVPAFFTLLVVLGVASLGFQSMASSSVQLWVGPEYRGRVMGLYTLVFVGGTTIGSPIVGAITNHFGARFGMAFCGLVSAAAAVVIGFLHVGASRRAGDSERGVAFVTRR